MLPYKNTITATDRWRQAYPGAHIGLLLVSGADNTVRPTALEQAKRQLEAVLRKRYQDFDRPGLRQISELNAYRAYYKRFGNTYHVQLQLESVVLGGKSLPAVSPLVDACFAAELETLILTASHDSDRLVWPVEIDVAIGGERIVQMSGVEKAVKTGDMLMRDALSVVCTVLYGQDQRTAITPNTRRALFVAYVPAGIPQEIVSAHLEQIKANVLLFTPQAEVEYQSLLTAG
jgi:DNA/RNA-binding domain of Phe-tRNA-synthetase-like protein